MILTGIADEAGDTIERQLAAHQALGWDTLELRLVEGQNIAAALPDDRFEHVADAVEGAGFSVTSFASAIGNWRRPITGDFEIDVAELTTAIRRMGRLGVRYIRTMSWLQGDATDAYWQSETIRRYKKLAQLACDAGIVLVHENCTGWAAQSPENTVRLIEEVASEHLGVLFDIAATVAHGHDPWHFYQGVQDRIRYVHVKDCRWAPDRGRSQDYVYPGEGDAMVQPILADLLAHGYDGIIAMEPHIARVVHAEGADAPDPETLYNSYLNYGRRFCAIVDAAQKDTIGS